MCNLCLTDTFWFPRQNVQTTPLVVYVGWHNDATMCACTAVTENLRRKKFHCVPTCWRTRVAMDGTEGLASASGKDEECSKRVVIYTSITMRNYYRSYYGAHAVELFTVFWRQIIILRSIPKNWKKKTPWRIRDFYWGLINNYYCCYTESM